MKDITATLTRYKTAAITIAVIIVCIIIVWLFIKYSGFGKSLRDKIAQKKLDELLDGEMNTESVSISDAQLKMMSDKLYTAMSGVGTDEDAIYEVFGTLSTRSEVIALIKSFGVRDGENLIQWLTSELNASERTKLNKILSDNNINYQI